MSQFPPIRPTDSTAKRLRVTLDGPYVPASRLTPARACWLAMLAVCSVAAVLSPLYLHWIL